MQFKLILVIFQLEKLDMKNKQTIQSQTFSSVKSLGIALILGPAASLSVNAYTLN